MRCELCKAEMKPRAIGVVIHTDQKYEKDYITEIPFHEQVDEGNRIASFNNHDVIFVCERGCTLAVNKNAKKR